MAVQLETTEEFRHALDLLEAGRCMFLTGNAGTGKSTLIRHFMASTRRRVVVAAPTGVAALNVGGYTLHRLFSFTTHTTISDIRGGGYRPQRFARAIKSLDTLIIDEASMVRADLFDMVCAALERFGPHPGAPLGGIQLVLVGDLYQLPPVVPTSEEDYFATEFETPYFFSARAYDSVRFPTVNLTKVFRQRGDTRLTDMLNAIRSGRMTRAITDALNRQVNPEFETPEGEFWLTLATTNRIVGARNRRHLEALPTRLIQCKAVESGSLERFDPPTDAVLTFKIGAQVMMLTNDAADRWVNGSLGRIVDVQGLDGANETSSSPCLCSAGDDITVLIELRDGSTVEVAPHAWEATEPTVEHGVLRHNLVGAFMQLPFKLAWAITIHKSQGQTLDRAVIDLSGGTFATGQLYVALSRCTSLSGLVLTRPVLPRDVKVDHRIRTFLRDVTGVPTRRKAYCGSLLCGRGDGFVRPLEIAFACDDGSVFSSLVNPTRDLGDAAATFGVTAADLEIAPRLADVWPAVEERISGFALVAPSGDDMMRVWDDELKRTGIVAPLESVLAVDSLPGTSSTAEQVAVSLRDRAHYLPAMAPAYTPVDEPRATWTLPRSPRRIEPHGDPREVAAVLEVRLTGSKLSEASARLVDEFCARFGVSVVYERRPEQMPWAEFVHQRANQQIRVCFTGTATCGGTTWRRDDMEDLARSRGLVVAASVSKTKCDALIAADVSSMSRKAQSAAKWGKPIFGAEEFIAWAQG